MQAFQLFRFDLNHYKMDEINHYKMDEINNFLEINKLSLIGHKIGKISNGQTLFNPEEKHLIIEFMLKSSNVIYYFYIST